MMISSAMLVACGGGGSSSAPTTPVTPVMVKPITVVPAMGGFSEGANVTFLDPKGIKIAAATTNTSGAAIVDIGTYIGPFISQVTGGPNVTVYNERTKLSEPFGATNSLLAVIPSVPTGANSRLGVTPLTNAAAAVLISNPLSPVIPGATTASIQAAVAQANATVAVAAGLPQGVSLLSAPEPLTSPTSKITTTDPAAAAYGAFLASLAINSTGSLISNASALSKDAASNGGALPASANLLVASAASLSAVISANVAPASITSLGTSLTALTSKVIPDPKLANAASLSAISSIATASNGGVVVPPAISVPTSTPTVIVAPVAPAVPAVPALPVSVAVTSTTSCVATVEGARLVYASQANTNDAPSSATPLQQTVITNGTALPSVTGTTWTATAPSVLNGGFSTPNLNWYTYTAVTNSGCASGMYNSTPISAGTTAYFYTPTTVAIPAGSFLPTCPTPAQMATSTGTVLVTSTTAGISSQYGYTGNLVNGVIYGFFPTSGATSGSGSALFSGSVTGSSGGSNGLTLPASGSSTSSPSFLSGSGSATQTFINFGSTGSNVAITINSVLTNYNVRKNTTNGQIELACQ